MHAGWGVAHRGLPLHPSWHLGEVKTPGSF